METDWLTTDSMAPNMKVPLELARESLIAISQATPGKNLASPGAPVKSSDVTVASAKDRTNLHINLLPADSVAPKTEISHELTRESLIAISQATPGKILSSPSAPAPANSNDVIVASAKDSGEAEKYRSKLISISYTQSPDVQPPPYSP